MHRPTSLRHYVSRHNVRRKNGPRKNVPGRNVAAVWLPKLPSARPGNLAPNGLSEANEMAKLESARPNYFRAAKLTMVVAILSARARARRIFPSGNSLSRMEKASGSLRLGALA
jgi:hypothetical protein